MSLYVRIITSLHSKERFRRALDFIIAWVIFSLPEAARRAIFFGNNHFCPLCQAKIRNFLNLHRHYNLICPVCRSLQRHRLIWLFLQQTTHMDSLSGKKLLHIAPEPSLSARFRKVEGLEYITGDLNDPKAMFKLDIENLQFAENTFDMLICSHVLEHVQDDQKAMRELSRVLKPEGWAVILAPITSQSTIEDPSVTDPVEREKLFGQFDHLRRYGTDVIDRLEKNGFHIRIFRPEDLVASPDIERFGLTDKDSIFFCRKWSRSVVSIEGVSLDSHPL